MKKLFKNLTKTKKYKYNFINLKITGYFASPLFLNDELNFDAIIYYAFIRYYVGSDYYNFGSGKDTEPYNFEEINLPIKRSEGNKYFLSSIGEYNKSCQFIQKYRKRYNELSINEWCKPKKLVTGKGKYKNYDRPIILQNCEKIEFYCVGDIKEISKLLKIIQALGKKQSQGFGLIKKWQVESINNLKNIMRAVETTAKEAISFGNIQPPYYGFYQKKVYFNYKNAIENHH